MPTLEIPEELFEDFVQLVQRQKLTSALDDLLQAFIDEHTLPEMLPCPFCGSINTEVAFNYYWRWVRCNDCKCNGPMWDMPRDAIMAWNTTKAEGEGLCPWCGGNEYGFETIDNVSAVTCYNDSGDCGTGPEADTEEEAERLWRERNATPATEAS